MKKGVLLNLRSYEVHVNGDLVNLTSKEFDLLKLLLSNPGRVFTKAEIFEKVWGYASEDNVPTVTVHIRKLREKLEFNPAEPEYIKTIWGVGYKFEK